ncbi:MAG: hypothetical protein PWP31_1530 [Clostridia bacterium]|nr:hypothetical protein [Clostridia bacterium]
MLLIAVRALILYILLVIVMRFMGKRQIGQMQPYELVITIIIAELAALPMSNTGIPLTSGIIGILVLLVAEMVLSLVSLHSEKARAIICGTPTILIENGQFVPEAMQRLRVNINDILEQLRDKEYPDVSDVAYAIMETNGTISVIPKSDARPPTSKELGMNIKQPKIPITLIMDGHVNLRNLKIAQITLDSLTEEAKKRNITDLRDVFFAQLTSKGQIDFYCE